MRTSNDFFFRVSASDFKKIPGSPIAYWVSENEKACFQDKYITNEINIKSGLLTGNDDLFLRVWFEVSHEEISFRLKSMEEIISVNPKWLPVTGGGEFRKWYGNLNSVVNSFNSFSAIENLKGNNFRLRDSGLYFKKAINWPMISSVNYGAKLSPQNVILGNGVRTGFVKKTASTSIEFIISYLSSIVSKNFLKIINPTLNYNNENIAVIPLNYLFDKFVHDNGCRNIQLSKLDWDSYETSWDFAELYILHSINKKNTVNESYQNYINQCCKITEEMKHLEEENNRIFIQAYGLQDELTPEVPIEEITLFANPKYRYKGELTNEELESRFKADTMKELLSYAVGCMMGRYSLDVPGLVYAHAENNGFDPKKYKTFPADDDGIIPITEREWFDDDAACRFFRFIEAAWDKKGLDENLDFVAEAIGRKSGESSREAIRRYFANDFFKVHTRTYKNRPIYWLFSSGKEKAFQALVYLHRYNEGTLARMRTEYVLPLQTKISRQIEHFEKDKDAAQSGSAANKISKEIIILRKQAEELSKFDELLRHYADKKIKLDLDDGVKINYGKFGDLLDNVNKIAADKSSEQGDENE